MPRAVEHVVDEIKRPNFVTPSVATASFESLGALLADLQAHYNEHVSLIAKRVDAMETKLAQLEHT